MIEVKYLNLNRANVEVYSRDNCRWCDKAIALLQSYGIEPTVMKLGEDYTREQLIDLIKPIKGQVITVPQIVIHDQVIGGYDQLVEYIEQTGFTGTGNTL